MSRLRNLWRLSKIEVPMPGDTITLSKKLIRAITGKKEATIVETADLPDLFPDHDETIK
jgi:hypothetical protein